MITFKNVSKSYEDQKVLSNVTLDLPRNGVVGIFGPSGIGKTTMFHLIAGLIKPDEGTIKVTEDISMVFQEERLIPWLSIKDNIAFVLNDDNDNNEKISKYLNNMELYGIEDKKPKELSGGMQRRVAIARALSYDKRIILMDEPFKGLEDELKYKIMDQIKKLSKNKLIIIITHDKDELEYLGSTIFSLDTNHKPYLAKFI